MGFIIVPALLLFLLCCLGVCALCGYLTAKVAEPILWKRIHNGKGNLEDALKSVARKTRLWKYMGFLVAFGMIFGHDIYTVTKWNKLCSDRGGIRVYRTDHVQGFLIEHNGVFLETKPIDI
jgi:hypothetical protein